jgi:pimeloyl-ACP methyl ester carboxylesterase
VTPGASSTACEPGELQSPLELLEALDVTEAEVGAGITHVEITTPTGLLGLLWHGRPESGRALVTCPGVFGGFLGPGRGLFQDLAQALATLDVCTVRIDYRRPGHLASCVLDAGVAMDVASRRGAERFALLGHSFGGAVAIRAASRIEMVTAVVTLATQSAGVVPPQFVSEMEAGPQLLGDRPFLLVHGDRDELIPAAVSDRVRDFVGHGEVVRLRGAGHRMVESAAELRQRLPPWVVAALDGRPQRF